MTLRVGVRRVAIIGPGLPDWANARAVLAGAAGWPDQPIAIASPVRLPATERRRVGASVRLALALAEQLFADDPARGADTATVFASSTGDGETCHLLCEALADPEPQVSPTRFTHSVHNAPAGYWGIAAGAQAPSTSLAMHDGSFAAGLLEAALQAVVERCPVALVAYDVPYPFPLSDLRPIGTAFGIALELVPSGTPAAAGLPSLSIGGWTPGVADRLAEPSLEALRCGAPAARGLPLLALLARGARGTVRLAGPGSRDTLPVDVEEPG